MTYWICECWKAWRTDILGSRLSELRDWPVGTTIRSVLKLNKSWISVSLRSEDSTVSGNDCLYTYPLTPWTRKLDKLECQSQEDHLMQICLSVWKKQVVQSMQTTRWHRLKHGSSHDRSARFWFGNNPRHETSQLHHSSSYSWSLLRLMESPMTMEEHLKLEMLAQEMLQMEVFKGRLDETQHHEDGRGGLTFTSCLTETT